MAQSEKQLYDTINDALAFFQSNFHTNLLGKVSAVHEKTIDVEPVINRVVNGKSEKITVFTNVPPLFMYGGGSSETWPISEGDYCVLFVTERAYDYWYNGQDFRAPIEPRMHDYSDCLALICAKNRDGALTIPTVITRIGDMFHQGNIEHIGNVEQTGDYTQEGDLTRTGSRTQTGDDNVTGNGTYSGTVTAAATVAQSFGAAGGGPVNSSGGFSAGGTPGVSGTFTTVDGKTVTVTLGIITAIV